MARATVSTFENGMKRYYKYNDPRDLTYPRNPMFGMLKKTTDLKGFTIPVAYKYAHNVGGTSAVFSTAQANANTVGMAQLQITRVKRYGVARIENELLLASTGDKAAFLAAGPAHTDGVIEELTNDLGRAIYLGVGGARGRINASAPTDADPVFTFILATTEDVVNFEVGHVLEHSSTDGSAGGSPTDDGILTVTSVDRTTGTIVINKESGTDDVAANDYLFVQGDFGVAVTGLSTWVPTTDAAVGTIFSFDRSVDPVRLGGNRFNGVTFSIEEALQKGGSETSRNGGKLEYGYLNPTDWTNLMFELATKLVRDKVSSPDKATIGYNAIVLQTAAGDVKLIADRNCPLGTAWLMAKDACEFSSLGPAPHMLKAKTQDSWIWEGAQDSIEMRAGWYGQFIVTKPINVCRVTLPT